MAAHFVRFALILAVGNGCFAQTFDAEFKSRAFEHVKYLAGLGNRLAGSQGDGAAIRYIAEQMNPGSLDRAAKLVAAVIERYMKAGVR